MGHQRMIWVRNRCRIGWFLSPNQALLIVDGRFHIRREIRDCKPRGWTPQIIFLMDKSFVRPLPRSFYSRPTLTVTRELLGCVLVRQLEGVRLSGIIVEAEAYVGEEDLACHAKAGKTLRTKIMYGPAGFTYVYFTYGVHWMLNIVTEKEGYPAAVLIRAIQPVEGIKVMQQLRGGKELSLLCSGPAKLTQALGITQEQNSLDLCQASSEMWIEPGVKFSKDLIATAPRVGLGQTPEPWRSEPWRYLVKDSPFVSK